MRLGEELRGSSASLSRAAKRSSPGSDLSLAIAFRRCRLPAKRFASAARFRFLSTALVFAIEKPSLASVDERHLEAGKQRPGFLVGARRGDDDDVHAAHRIHLVVIDLREYQLLLEA